MNIFTFLTPITYWVLIVMWSFILLFYIKRLRSETVKGQLLYILLIILAIDAFRTLFESIYFGAWYTSLAGFLPKEVFTFLVRPELVFIPKFLNTIAAAIIIGILLYQWLPKEEQEKYNLESLIKQSTTELILRNEQLNKEINERKQTEKALRESEEKYRILVKNANDAIFVTQDDVVKFPNRKSEELTGYSAEELSRISFADLIHPDDKETVIDKHKRRLKGEKFTSTYSFKLINKSGLEKTVHLNTVLIQWEGRPATLNFLRDITQQVELESQLRQSQKMEAIGTLAGGIAHDFNNILSIILGYSDMLGADLPADVCATRELNEIIKAGNRAKDLVSQILAFSRQNKKVLMPIQPDLIIKEALKMLRASIPSTIEIRHDVPKCGSTIGDPTQLHQIMMNLCTNAYHAMWETGGVLEVLLEPIVLEGNDIKILSLALPPGPYVKLEISDTGHGIDKATQQRIFDPYFTTKKKGEGTGLGLAVVHGIVKSFGGHISVYSEPGEGTTFRIYLPQISLEAEIQPDKFIEPIPTGDEHILVVDDEESIVQMEKQMLESLGYQVSDCTSSPEALKIFRNQPEDFSLVITDMTMPDMTGVELVQRVRTIRQNIPIILCSGFSELINEEKAKGMGIRKYLMKPVLKRELAAAVREMLDEDKRSE